MGRFKIAFNPQQRILFFLSLFNASVRRIGISYGLALKVLNLIPSELQINTVIFYFFFIRASAWSAVSPSQSILLIVVPGKNLSL